MVSSNSQITAKAKQDRIESVSATEFEWEMPGETPIHRLVGRPISNLLNRHGAKRVLDLGSGNGAFTAYLARNGFDVVGLDASASGVSLARKSHPGIRFDQFDLANEIIPADLSSQFDAVVSCEVIEHLFQPRRLVEHALSALHNGGMLVITTPYHGYWKNLLLALVNGFDRHWHPLRDYGHIKFFSVNTIKSLLEEYGMQEIEIQRVGRIPPIACSMIASARYTKV